MFLARARELLPLSEKECDRLFRRVDDTIRATVNGHPVGRRIHEHALLVFLSIMGGLIYLGAACLVAGPLLLALADGLIRIGKDRTNAYGP